MSASASPPNDHGEHKISSETYVQTQKSAKFQELRSRHRKFVFPVTIAFLVWYFLYVLLANYAPDFMSIKLGNSNINIGLIFGLLQFVTTFAVTTWYVSYSNKKLDPLAEELRDSIDHQSQISGTSRDTVQGGQR